MVEQQSRCSGHFLHNHNIFNHSSNRRQQEASRGLKQETHLIPLIMKAADDLGPQAGSWFVSKRSISPHHRPEGPRTPQQILASIQESLQREQQLDEPSSSNFTITALKRRRSLASSAVRKRRNRSRTAAAFLLRASLTASTVSVGPSDSTGASAFF